MNKRQAEFLKQAIIESNMRPTSREDADNMLVPLEKLKATDWFKSRPKKIQRAITLTPPDKRYLMDTGHLCRIISFAEGDPITCTVAVLFVDNPGIAFERRVFGIDPKTLKPWRTQ